MIDALQTASAGMVSASRRLDAAARDVAERGTGTVGTALPPAAQVDLSTTALDLIGSRTAFAMNAAVLKVADTMQARLVDRTV